MGTGCELQDKAKGATMAFGRLGLSKEEDEVLGQVCIKKAKYDDLLKILHFTLPVHRDFFKAIPFQMPTTVTQDHHLGTIHWRKCFMAAAAGKIKTKTTVSIRKAISLCHCTAHSSFQ